MKLVCIATALVIVATLFAGCSGGGSGDTEYVVRDGKAYCVFPASGHEFAVGTIEGDEVKLYATYGGSTMSATALESKLRAITVAGTEDFDAEQRLVLDATAVSKETD